MHHGLRILAATAALALAAAPAHARVIISSAATQNMSCSGHICTPTAKSAVLNVGDLENFLASGNLTVITTGTGVQANDIEVKALVTWSTSDRLVLDAYQSIIVDKPVSVVGLSGLTLTTDDGGANGILSFGPKGNVTFANLSSQLTINASPYALVGDIKTLASDIASNPGGDFALANSYDAGPDGVYQSSPVPTVFSGTFEGLGNVMSNLSIDGPSTGTQGDVEGLFGEVQTTGTLRDIGLENATVDCAIKFVSIGPLVGENWGTVWSSHATGAVSGTGTGREFLMGGLIGDNIGTIANSYAAVAVTGRNGSIGGLAGDATGAIVGSFATGAVMQTRSNDDRGVAPFLGGGEAGGLAGYGSGTITNSYATGKVKGGKESRTGGLLGLNYATVSSAYSLGSATAGAGGIVGGLIGDDESQPGSLDATYWDMDTSGITDPSQGAGNIPNDPGITGLTTAQFQSGLPAGFDPSVWAEKSKINGGLPYLLANPPPK